MAIDSTRREEVSLSLVDGGDESLAFYFSRLRLLCSEVIGLVQSPKRSGEPLVALAEFVRTSPAAHLQSCFDYILVPLLLLLDGALFCRKEVTGLEETQSPVNNVPHTISDNVAESLLLCLQELLKRCHLSCIDQLAETEASRGHHGSAELRSEALLTLRVLIAKVGTADRLAFFLPGVVSRFAKALNVSKTMISGAAGSTESMAHVIYGLGELLVITFGDEVNFCGLGMSLEDLKGSCLKKNQSAQLVLETLRLLPTVSEETDIINTSGSNFASTSILLKTDMQEKSTDKSLFVDRNKDWIDKTSECVDKLLSATFPHLCVNPAKKVRLALVSCIYGLLTNCINTMKKSKLMLLECLYVLVCDDSAVVASTAQEYLEILMLDNKYLEEDEIAKTLQSLIRQLPKVVLGSEDTVALAHAQKLLAAVYYAGPQRVVDHILGSPDENKCGQLQKCFEAPELIIQTVLGPCETMERAEQAAADKDDVAAL
ncbi:hypothetical protein EJ110_NYTH31694 [Nymphaea thermarum]|nr:hypothetical protein EJ110_NYTH31694 [Nymphaea thermarum]